MHAGDELVNVLKGRGVGDVMGTGRELADFVVDVLGAIAGVGVIAEELSTALAVFALNDFEELRHGAGVVARVVQDGGTEFVGLLLGSA